MDRISRIGFCLILIGIYWIPIADSQFQPQCYKVGYFEKCGVCSHNKTCHYCDPSYSSLQECGNDNRCRCIKNHGYKEFGIVKGCIPGAIVGYGQRCWEPILCNGDDSLICHPPKTGKCVCMEGYERNEELRQCISKNGLILDVCIAEPKDTCNKSQQLICDKVKHRCLVQNGYKYNCETSEFEKGIREHNEICDDDSCKTVEAACDPCNPDNHLECKNRTCECKEGYKYDEAKKKCTDTGKGLTTKVSWVLIGLCILLLLLLLLAFLAYWFCCRKRKKVSGEGVRGVSGEVRENEVGGAGSGLENGESKKERKRRWWQRREYKPKPPKKTSPKYDMSDTDADFSNVSNLWKGKEHKRKPSKNIPLKYDMPDTDADFSNVSNLWKGGHPPSAKNKKKVTLDLKEGSEKSKIQAHKESKAKRPSTT